MGPIGGKKTSTALIPGTSIIGYHKTLVAIANKHARQVWAMLVKGEAYDQDAWKKFAKEVAAQ